MKSQAIAKGINMLHAKAEPREDQGRNEPLSTRKDLTN
jgi:hypothetical protein